MTALEVYQAAMRPPHDKGMSQNDFMSLLNASMLEILNLYGDKYTVYDSDGQDVRRAMKALTINDGLDLRDEYFDALVCGVLYRYTGDTAYRNEFGNKAQAAYLNVWRQLSKGRTVKPNDWSDRVVRQRSYNG